MVPYALPLTVIWLLGMGWKDLWRLDYNETVSRLLQAITHLSAISTTMAWNTDASDLNPPQLGLFAVRTLSETGSSQSMHGMKRRYETTNKNVTTSSPCS
jgi:hypothetical protein